MKINNDDRNQSLTNFLLDEFLKNYIFEFINAQIDDLNSEHIIAKNKLNEEMKKFENGIKDNPNFVDKELDKKITSLTGDYYKKSDELKIAMKKKNFIETHEDFYNGVISLIFSDNIPSLAEINSNERSEIIDNLISANISKYFNTNKKFLKSLNDDYTEFNSAFEHCYYLDFVDGIRTFRSGEFSTEEKQIVINEYFTNTPLYKREVYPPRSIKGIYVINELDDCKYLFMNLKENNIQNDLGKENEKSIKKNLVDKIMINFFKPMHVQEIKKNLLKGDSVLFGYSDIFDIDITNVYKLSDEWRTSDLKLKGYLLINNLNKRLITIEDSIVDEVREREEFKENETKTIIEEHDKHVVVGLDEADRKRIIDKVLKAVSEYESTLTSYRSKYFKDSETKTSGNDENKQETSSVVKKRLVDIIYLKDRIVCQITPQMIYLSMNDKMVLGVKTYDVFTDNGEKYIYAKDHYYSKYRVVRHGETHRYSVSRETASLDELIEYFDVTELNINITATDKPVENLKNSNIHLAGTDGSDEEDEFDSIGDPTEYIDDDDNYEDETYSEYDYSISDTVILGDDDYDD